MKKVALPGAVGRARALRHKATDAEKRLWWALRERLPSVHFRRQAPIGAYIADFCCHAEKLIVEVDGVQHDNEVDAARTAFPEGEGYSVLRFWNSDVLLQTEDVVEAISRGLRGCHPHLTSPIEGGGTGPCGPDGP